MTASALAGWSELRFNGLWTGLQSCSSSVELCTVPRPPVRIDAE